MRKIKHILYLNLAACYLKTSDPPNALKASEEALEIEPQNPKSLYRKAKALTMNKNASK